MTPHLLQCHLRVMHLFRQNHLGWSPQAQQVAHQKIVQIDLLHLATALKPPGTNFLGDIEIWFSRQCWTDWHLGCMAWSMYQSVYGVFSMYHAFWKEYSATCTLLTTSSVCQAWLTSASRGKPLMKLLRWIPGQGREWTEGHLAQLQLPFLWKIVLR